MNVRHNMAQAARLLLSAAILGLPSSILAADASPALSWNCAGCHGTRGVSVGGAVPSIAGFNERYFFTVMRGFKLDERYSTIMGRIAKGYKVKEMRAMAAYFGQQPWPKASVGLEPEQVALGETVHDEWCAECHEDGGRYQDKEIPRLAGQRQEYLLLQMNDYRAPEPLLPQPDKMRQRMQDLSAGEVEALSGFYAQVGEDYRANDPVADATD
jgi:sulfide dehydrogenase cytochrome subunit